MTDVEVLWLCISIILFIICCVYGWTLGFTIGSVLNWNSWNAQYKSCFSSLKLTCIILGGVCYHGSFLAIGLNGQWEPIAIFILVGLMTEKISSDFRDDSIMNVFSILFQICIILIICVGAQFFSFKFFVDIKKSLF